MAPATNESHTLPHATPPVITLTTDFGVRDSYVGIMKGVILSICPHARLVDITHAIPPQDVAAAAFQVQAFAPSFPPGTIHLVVVDPGVGSARHALALQTPQACYVGPDNGVFGAMWQAARATHPADAVAAVALQEPRFWLPQVSSTFHGRDIFAPVAAHLACGVALDDLGVRLETVVTLPHTEPVWEHAHRLVGAIIAIDHFGNSITSITSSHLAHLPTPAALTVQVEAANGARHTLHGIYHTYADVAPGAALALVGSTEHLEIAVRNGNASQQLDITTGCRVVVTAESTE